MLCHKFPSPKTHLQIQILLFCLVDAEDLAGNWRFRWSTPYISSWRCWTIIRGLPYQKWYWKKSWFCSCLWKYENANNKQMEFVTLEHDPKKTYSIMEDDSKNLLKTFFKIKPAHHPGILREMTSEILNTKKNKNAHSEME